MTDLPPGRPRSREPFAPFADPEIIFDTPHTAETFSRLSLLGAGGPRLAVLTGEPGTGKTTMLHRVIEARQRAGSRTMIENLPLDLDDFLARLPAPEPGHEVIVGLDEAQALSRELLGSLDAILSARPDLRLILAGGPLLEDTVAELRRRGAPLPAAVQRRLTALAAGEVGSYIERRWRTTAVGANPFVPGAVAKIATASEGIPQMINVLCSRLLRLADLTGRDQVTGDMVDEVTRELPRGPARVRRGQGLLRDGARPWRLAPAGVASALIVLLIVLGANRLNDPALRRAERPAPPAVRLDLEPRPVLPKVASLQPEPQPSKSTSAAVPVAVLAAVPVASPTPAPVASTPVAATAQSPVTSLPARTAPPGPIAQATPAPIAAPMTSSAPAPSASPMQTPVAISAPAPSARTTPAPVAAPAPVASSAPAPVAPHVSAPVGSAPAPSARPATAPAPAPALATSSVPAPTASPAQAPAAMSAPAVSVRPAPAPVAAPVPTPVAPVPIARPAPTTTVAERVPPPLVAAAAPMLPPRALPARPLATASRRDSAKDEALLQRAEDGDVRAITALLAEGASLEARDASGFTPLMLAVIHGHAGAVDALVAAGAGVNVQNRAGLTAVMLAAINNHTAVIAALADRGADLDQRTRAGWTALTYAAWRGHADAVRLLLSRGANPNVTDREGWTILQYASWRAAEPMPREDLPDVPAHGDISRVTGGGPAHKEIVALLRRAGVKR